MSGLDLPIELIKQYGEYMKARHEGIVLGKQFFFAEIMPRLQPWLEQQEGNRKLRELGNEFLVSLMGFSPETTVQVAVILRPKKVRIAYSADAEEVFNIAVDYLQRNVGYRPADIKYETVDAFDPDDIYLKLRKLVPSSGSWTLDITGGTKVMSATAGYLAWEMGSSICYLQGVWSPEFGASGLEKASRLAFFQNPSRQKGYEIRNSALEFYKQGNFLAAKAAFISSRRLVPDYALEDFCIPLCECYSAMADLSLGLLGDAQSKLGEAILMAEIRRLFEGRFQMEGHIQAMRKLAAGDREALTAAFLELAAIYKEQGRNDFACMLCYRAMEALVETGLKRLKPKFDLRAPDWSLLMEKQELERQLQEMEGDDYRGLPPFVGLEAGFVLLCVLDRLEERFPETVPTSVLEKKGARKEFRRAATGKIRGYAARRNESILAHGQRTLGDADSELMLNGARCLAEAIYGEQIGDFNNLRSQLRRPPLSELPAAR